MDWKSATLGQLFEIAFHDTECNPRFRFEAIAEIKRRNNAKKKHNDGVQVKIRRKQA